MITPAHPEMMKFCAQQNELTLPDGNTYMLINCVDVRIQSIPANPHDPDAIPRGIMDSEYYFDMRPELKPVYEACKNPENRPVFMFLLYEPENNGSYVCTVDAESTFRTPFPRIFVIDLRLEDFEPCLTNHKLNLLIN